MLSSFEQKDGQLWQTEISNKTDSSNVILKTNRWLLNVTFQISLKNPHNCSWLVQRSSDSSLTWHFVELKYVPTLLGDSFSPFIILPNFLVSFIQSNPNLTILTFIYPSINIQCFLLYKILDVKLFQGWFA